MSSSDGASSKFDASADSATGSTPLRRPLRVIIYCGGPELEDGLREFICRLEEEPRVEVLRAYREFRDGEGLRGMCADLWRRRGVFAVPILLSRFLGTMTNALRRTPHDSRSRAAVSVASDRIVCVDDLHAKRVVDEVRELAPDLGLVYGGPILKSSLFEIPAHGTLGIHHGAVPAYRGKKTTFWAVYNEEATAGVTIQRLGRGVDTGDVVKAGSVRIDGRLPASVFRDLESLGVDLYVAAVLEVRDGTAEYQPQRGPPGRLYRDPGVRDWLVLLFRRFLALARGGSGRRVEESR